MPDLTKPVMKNLLCTNNVVHTGGYGRTMRSVVFTDTSTPGMNYIWVTTGGDEFIEGQFYDITAQCNSHGVLKRVKIFKDHSKSESKSKSEQPDKKIKSNPVDVFDLIFETN